MRGFINGVVFTVAVALGAGFAAIKLGLVRAGADAKPSALESWAAKTSLHATLKRDTKGLQSPLEPTDANLTDGLHLYAANCAVCHGASDGKPSKLAQGFSVEAPMLATDGVEDDPVAVSYWKIKHGIRFTAMPSFATTLSDEDDWKIALFLSKMDHLPPAVDAEWKKVPSAARGS